MAGRQSAGIGRVPYVTLAERKRRAVAVMAAGLQAAEPALAATARRLGGRYLLFGSVARGRWHADSDVDLLLDFPAETEDAAWTEAEAILLREGLRPDILPLRLCSVRFRDTVLPTAREITG